MVTEDRGLLFEGGREGGGGKEGGRKRGREEERKRGREKHLLSREVRNISYLTFLVSINVTVAT